MTTGTVHRGTWQHFGLARTGWTIRRDEIGARVSTEASEALRGLIDAIVLRPDQGELQIELKGNLAAMRGAATNAKRSPETGDRSLQIVMVAGACNPLNLEFAWTAA